ncbi:hypothetical protein [Saccharospirillum impatiens]|uniref:hypothetical protein n=1 Tax=Saccharospirillum impatiens TaxID=169438 RepID=UPI000406C871|nr:hypothetical protein [Saccharospirillum impatiens]
MASEVNENFSSLETAVDDNHQKIEAMQDEIDALVEENQSLLEQLELLQNAVPTAVAMPVFPRGAGPNFADYALVGGKGVFTIEFNVQVNPETFNPGTNVIVSGAGGIGSGSISWSDNFSTLIFTTLENFTTISPCFSGGLNFTIQGTGELAPQDTYGKPIDGDRDGAPGGDFTVTYDIVC